MTSYEFLEVKDAPDGLRRPDNPPNTIITPGYVGRWHGKTMITGWNSTGPWPLRCMQDGIELYFGYTLEELQAIDKYAEPFQRGDK